MTVQSVGKILGAVSWQTTLTERGKAAKDENDEAQRECICSVLSARFEPTRPGKRQITHSSSGTAAAVPYKAEYYDQYRAPSSHGASEC